MDTEIKAVLDETAKTFDAFKAAHSELEAEVKKIKGADYVTSDKLKRIDDALEASIAAKTALEKKMSDRADEIEKKLNRANLTGSRADDDKRAVEIKAFNDTLAAEAASKNRQHTALDDKGYDEYRSAFGSMLRKNDRLLTPDEVKTLSVGSDPDGGYFVTPDISGRIVKKVYETSPIRQIASAMTISTDALEGIEDLGEAGAGYAGEHTQGSDTTTPQVGKWRIPVFWIDTEPKTTQQLLDDASVNVEGWLADKVADKFSRFENAEFVTGAANKIRGLAGYTMAADSGSGVTWGTVGYVATGTAGAFPSANPADKLYDVTGCLKQAYLPNARFLTRRSVITLIRKFKDGMGNYLWQPSFVAGVSETIMGYPVTRAEDIAAVTTDSLSLAFGDFAQAYQIVDRQGVRVLRDPYTAKPYVKFYTTKRTGGGIVNFEALKFLKFGTS
jgi:HK97 family phage major capsid protein